ncbi:MAG: M15 family metallopeptidase [Acidimicrobiales bacterium]
MAAVLGSCGADASDAPLDRSVTSGEQSDGPTPQDTSTTVANPTTTTTTTPSATTPRPDWIGTRVLPTAANGFGEIQPTPPELADRRFATIDVLPPPTTDEFAFTVDPAPADVVARSTWSEACPVDLDQLRYMTLPFWGFDGLLHTGELLVHADAVAVVVAGFSALFDRRFPIESMQITTVAGLDAPMTGDGNNTSAFVCRPSRGSTSWSEHARGRAVDINPFHNPYVKGDLVLPELASIYADRGALRPGMLTADDVAGFTSAGWGWGGGWHSLKDHMHLSADGS